MKKREGVVISKRRLGEALLSAGLLTKPQLDLALKEQARTGEKLGEVILRMGFVKKKELLKVLSDQWGVPFVDLKEILIDPGAIALVNETFARQHNLIPIRVLNGDLEVAMANPNDIYIIDELTRMTNRNIVPKLADDEQIVKAIEHVYGVGISPEEEFEKATKEALNEENPKEGTPPIIRIVEAVVIKGIKDRATDIHFEPDERATRIRYRIDGILHTAFTLPKRLYPAVVTRIKVISELDIAEQRIPQDGVFRFKYGLKSVDMRVSTYPTLFGESIVIRILERASILLGLEKLGFSPKDFNVLKKLIQKPYGIILVTGPTGSGKSTTLYSLLMEINTLEKNVITVEDPVEYQLPLIKQSSVNEKAGFTFARALKAILRHDPDVVLVGELRDKETASMAFRASMTGHLVLSTLHANSAADAIPRLIDMGIEPYAIATSLKAVLAQRLVRRICPHCKEEYAPSKEKLLFFGLEDLEGMTFYKGRGCEFCMGTGYKGRMVIAEILVVTPQVAQLIAEGASGFEIARVARYTTLKEDGIDKALKGYTTLEEVFRVTD